MSWGTLNDSRYGIRGRGEGKMALQIHDMMRLARYRYFKNKEFPKLNTTLYEQYKEGQWKLF